MRQTSVDNFSGKYEYALLILLITIIKMNFEFTFIDFCKSIINK